jgi:hypothetical protein
MLGGIVMAVCSGPRLARPEHDSQPGSARAMLLSHGPWQPQSMAATV